MNLQVLPLKVLATREVVIKRLDYSTYLTGITKEELDRLDKLEGRYRIQSSKLPIEAFDGKSMPSDDWEYFKECWGHNEVTEFIESASEFTIQETRGELRTWLVLDELYESREFLTGRGHVISEMGRWTTGLIRTISLKMGSLWTSSRDL